MQNTKQNHSLQNCEKKPIEQPEKCLNRTLDDGSDRQDHLKTYISMSQIPTLDILLDAQIGHLHTRMTHRMNTQKHDHLWKAEKHVTS